MTKDEVLQRANDYCNERSYDSETLTDDFKDKFAEFFAKKYPEDTAIDADGILDDIKFNLDTARSAAVKGLAKQQTTFSTKESDYLRQIEELRKKNGKGEKAAKVEIPDELKEQIAELQKFKDEEAKKERFANIVKLAKSKVRADLHKSFEAYAKNFSVNLEKDDKDQANALVDGFQEIFLDSYGSIKPLAPKQVQKNDEEFFASLPKIKVK